MAARAFGGHTRTPVKGEPHVRELKAARTDAAGRKRGEMPAAGNWFGGVHREVARAPGSPKPRRAKMARGGIAVFGEGEVSSQRFTSDPYSLYFLLLPSDCPCRACTAGGEGERKEKEKGGGKEITSRDVQGCGWPAAGRSWLCGERVDRRVCGGAEVRGTYSTLHRGRKARRERKNRIQL